MGRGGSFRERDMSRRRDSVMNEEDIRYRTKIHYSIEVSPNKFKMPGLGGAGEEEDGEDREWWSSS